MNSSESKGSLQCESRIGRSLGSTEKSIKPLTRRKPLISTLYQPCQKSVTTQSWQIRSAVDGVTENNEEPPLSEQEMPAAGKDRCRKDHLFRVLRRVGGCAAVPMPSM